MPVLEIGLHVRQDGAYLAGFPLIRRFATDEAQQFDFELASAADTVTWTALPATQVDTVTFVCVRSTQDITVRLDDQSDAAGRATIPIQAGGVLILIGTNIDSGAGANNARANNNSGATATLRGVIGGT